ncbi:aldo/keto reductase [Fredinandcohnia onubensis]|uniref:aldo/keto reductase n=1 Tax=Fredinandcohnia onubensis TaxID=1571209 RepID=UPI000C0BF3EC|nr:aldo/keto reductase [Fredinandcohnia onubensis]
MEKRRIGASDLYVSKIGLGCMSVGTEEKKALHMIDSALDMGINYLDTADLYDQGLNEEFVGKAIKQKRQDIILATKVGNRFEQGKNGWSWDPSKKYIKSAVKDSLRRLQTDYIDLYQLHGGTIEDPIDETIEAFEELTQEGVIRYYGISSIRPNVIREFVTKSSIVSVMMQYSILDRRPEEQILSYLNDHQISVVARGPVAKGLLTNRPMENASQSMKQNGYLDYAFEELETVISGLKSDVAGDRSLTEVALQYCLFNDTVASVVTGASSLEQIKNNVSAANSTPLTDEQVQIIRDLTKASIYEQHR